MKILSSLFPWFFSRWHSRRRYPLTATKAVLTWTYPKLATSKIDIIENPRQASLLLSAFDGILGEGEGTAHDTPFYDLEITFTLLDGGEIATKVYLPRQQLFPGMWKQPRTQALAYFDDQNGETKRLVETIRPYLPAIYPKQMDYSKSVPFHLGIPDFSKHDFPITGDFPPGTFVRGGPGVTQ